MKKLSFVLFLWLCSLHIIAQNVGIGTVTPNPKAMLHISSNTSGLLVPRSTAAQRSAMNANGLNDAGILMYDSTDQKFYYFNSAQNQWLSLPDNDWIIVGNDQYSGVSGNVGIGISTPAAKLHTVGDLRFEGLLTGNDTTVLIIDNLTGNVRRRPLSNDIWDGDDIGIQSVIGGTGISTTPSGTAYTINANVNNGLYINALSNQIRLGGTLVENTTISTGNFNLITDISGFGKFEIQNATNPALTVTNNGSIGVNNSTPQSNAIVDINSTTKGILLPRMTIAQRNTIASPPLGLIIYNIDDSVAQHYNGTCWLPMYQDDCNACDFTITLSDTFKIINKTTIDSVTTTINITQTAGSTAPINLYFLQNLPNGTNIYLSSYVVIGSGTATLTVTADIFATPGIYPIAIQALCGSSIKMQTFYVQIDSCYKVYVNTSVTDYDMQIINSLPSNIPICVIATVQQTGKCYGIGAPAFTTGNIHPQSQVGIINMGEIFGFGGDGANLASLTNFNINNPGAPGFPGGHAINLTVKSHIINNGFIFGGGGGGGSIGWAYTLTVPLPWPLPSPSISLGIGVGGGGGSYNGLGGSVPAGSIALGLIDAGDNATGGLNGVGGAGGVENIPISVPLGPVTLTVQPNAYGGDGGTYGVTGTSGTMNVDVCATIPIVGTICFGPFPNPPYSNTVAPGGAAGNAVKRNGNLLNGLLDGYYQIFQIRGAVGP